MPRVFVSHRGAAAAPHAARVRRDLLAALGPDRVDTDEQPGRADVVLVVVAPGDAGDAVDSETPELTAAQLEEIVLRDQALLTVKVVPRHAPSQVAKSGPRTHFLHERWWDLDMRTLVRIVEGLLERTESAEEPAAFGDGTPLERLLRAEASGEIVRRRRPHRASEGAAASIVIGGDIVGRDFIVSDVLTDVLERDRIIADRMPNHDAPAPRRERRAPWRRLLRWRPVLIPSLIAVGGGLLAVLVRWLAGSTIDLPASRTDDVDVTVFCPPRAAPGESLLVQVFAHLPAQEPDARAMASEFDEDAARRGFTSLSVAIAPGATLGFELRAADLEVDGHVRTLRWQRRAASIQFSVTVPADARPGTRLAKVIVSHDSVPVGEVAFKLTVTGGETAAAPAPAGEGARAYETAFISYAREDWAEVLRRVQVLRLPHLARRLRTFQDVLDVDPGERWAQRLYLEIDRCDVLLLFWSRAAHDSEWVRREVRYALERKVTELDAPEILPVVLEVPPYPPWPELADRHFDDAIARLIGAAREEPDEPG